jgi:ketosteroid isomerase-like protein
VLLANPCTKRWSSTMAIIVLALGVRIRAYTLRAERDELRSERPGRFASPSYVWHSSWVPRVARRSPVSAGPGCNRPPPVARDTERAMTQENVEIVRRFAEALNRGDREAVGALLHPEVEWHTLGGPLIGTEAIYGRDEALRFMFERIPDALEDFRAIMEEVSELPGGQVLGVARYEGRGVASGAEVKMNAAAIYRFESSMIVFFQDFPHRDKALEAAALEE